MGIECTLLEIQKLAYFLERRIEKLNLRNELDLRFEAKKYGPYAARLDHLLDALDGSYLHCDKRLADAGPFDVIWFDNSKKDKVAVYFTTPEAKPYRLALEETSALIDGFELPLGMELLATVDWLVHMDGIAPRIEDVKAGLKRWAGGAKSAERKQRLFDDRLINLALQRLAQKA